MTSLKDLHENGKLTTIGQSMADKRYWSSSSFRIDSVRALFKFCTREDAQDIVEKFPATLLEKKLIVLIFTPVVSANIYWFMNSLNIAGVIRSYKITKRKHYLLFSSEFNVQSNFFKLSPALKWTMNYLM